MKGKNKLLAILVAFTLSFGVSGCGSKVERELDNSASMFVKVERTMNWIVVYHKKTKVMYAVSNGSYDRGNFTLLVNPDGSPMLWKDER